jgi:hypothetical protein
MIDATSVLLLGRATQQTALNQDRHLTRWILPDLRKNLC